MQPLGWPFARRARVFVVPVSSLSPPSPLWHGACMCSAAEEARNEVSVVEKRGDRLVTVATVRSVPMVVVVVIMMMMMMLMMIMMTMLMVVMTVSPQRPLPLSCYALRQAEHRYRPSKLMFIPGTERIFATASDTVYLWDQSKRASDGYGRTVLSSPYERALTFADFEQSLEPLALPCALYPPATIPRTLHPAVLVAVHNCAAIAASSPSAAERQGSPQNIVAALRRPVWDTGKYCAPIVGFDVAGGTRLVAAHCDGQCVLWDLQTLQVRAMCDGVGDAGSLMSDRSQHRRPCLNEHPPLSAT
jgi:hypothetical protein